jgi:hypothetical protein
MELFDTLTTLWYGLGWPLLRLIFFISLGLLVGNLIESLNWTHGIAKLATPLIRSGHLSDTAGASFSMAFFSGVAANTMLAEAFDQGRITKQELIFANLFNSLPTYFMHLPTLFFIAVPLIGQTALVYVGLTLFAAFLRTAVIVIVGRLVITPGTEPCITCRLDEEKTSGFRPAAAKTWERFRKRIKRILVFTVPIYILIYFLGRQGLFDLFENFMADHLSLLAWLHPQTISIIVFQLTAELSAGLAAAGGLLDAGAIGEPEVVIALLAGNVISSPMRAVRHQLPFYSGIFRPRLAIELIIYNQSFRMGSILLVAVLYYFWSKGLMV